jgi:hypothetical protein
VIERVINALTQGVYLAVKIDGAWLTARQFGFHVAKVRADEGIEFLE